MGDLLDEVRAAFESEGHAVEDVSRNRSKIRVALAETGAGAEELRSIVTDVAGDDVLGVNVTTESVEGQDEIRTVVTVRQRS